MFPAVIQEHGSENTHTFYFMSIYVLVCVGMKSDIAPRRRDTDGVWKQGAAVEHLTQERCSNRRMEGPA
jgi:hypothetical protein